MQASIHLWARVLGGLVLLGLNPVFGQGLSEADLETYLRVQEALVQSHGNFHHTSEGLRQGQARGRALEDLDDSEAQDAIQGAQALEVILHQEKVSEAEYARISKGIMAALQVPMREAFGGVAPGLDLADGSGAKTDLAAARQDYELVKRYLPRIRAVSSGVSHQNLPPVLPSSQAPGTNPGAGGSSPSPAGPLSGGLPGVGNLDIGKALQGLQSLFQGLKDSGLSPQGLDPSGTSSKGLGSYFQGLKDAGLAPTPAAPQSQPRKLIQDPAEIQREAEAIFRSLEFQVEE